MNRAAHRLNRCIALFEGATTTGEAAAAAAAITRIETSHPKLVGTDGPWIAFEVLCCRTYGADTDAYTADAAEHLSPYAMAWLVAAAA